MTKYQIAEKFKSIQGEGLYAGTPMAFIRFVGCSVGKRICHACDTDFEKTLNWRGGGEFAADDLLQWADPHLHVCLTGGEPLDQDLEAFFGNCWPETVFHIETSGTIDIRPVIAAASAHEVERRRLWVCVSPKPGFLEEAVAEADEIKIIVPGLGSGDGWPTIDDAILWAHKYPEKPIFLQPRNGKFEIDHNNLRIVLDLLAVHPQFRLSDQLHKIMKVQ